MLDSICYWRCEIFARLDKFLGVVVAILTVAGFVLDRAAPTGVLQSLGKPVVHLSWLQLIAVTLALILAYRMLPPFVRRRMLRVRAERFFRDWKAFKRVLLEYQSSESASLQAEYGRLRERLNRDYAFFAPAALLIQRQLPSPEFAEVRVRNLRACLAVSQIEDWSGRVSRRLPDELDCFDSTFLTIIEHCEDFVPKVGASRAEKADAV